MRNVQKYIEEYRKRFFDKGKQYASISMGEYREIIESGIDGKKIDVHTMVSNAMEFAFMVGYKAAIREMKDRGRYRGNSNYDYTK